MVSSHYLRNASLHGFVILGVVLVLATAVLAQNNYTVDETGTTTVPENGVGPARMSPNKIQYTQPTNNSGTALFPNAFVSADNIAAQTATFMHGGMMAWDSGGGNWDRLLLTAGALHVNVQNGLADATASGSITAGGQRVSLALAGYSGASAAISGTFTATVVPQVSFDGGTNWKTISFYDAGAGTSDFVLSLASSGVRSIPIPAGASHVAITTSTFTSGTVNVALRATVAPGTTPTNPWFDAMTSEQLPAYHPMIMDPAIPGVFYRSQGMADGQDSAGTGIAAAGLLAQFDNTAPNAITENQFGNLRMSANRNLFGTLRDAAGNERGANVTASNALVTDSSASTQPISAASLPLPTGAATAALQDGIIKDGAGDTTQANVSGGRVHVDGSGVTQPVSGTVTVGAFPDNEPFNVAQIAGAVPSATNPFPSRLTDGTTFYKATTPTDSQIVQGPAATDAAVAGNPVLKGGRTEDSIDSAPGVRTSAEGEVAPISVTRDGTQRVIIGGTQTWSYHENSSSALTDATVHAAAGAGLHLYICTVTFSSGAATALNMFLEEGAATVMGPWYLEAIAGRGANLVFSPCKKQPTANTALTVTTSAAIAHSIDMTGYIAE